MRYKELISEAIATRPSNGTLFIQNRIKEIDAILAQLRHAQQLILPNIEGDSLLNQFLRYGIGEHFSDRYTVANTASGSLPDLIKNSYSDDEMRVRRQLPLVDLRRALANCLEHGATFLKYVMSTIDGAAPFDQDYLDGFTALDYASAGAEEYGYQPDDPANQEDEEYVQAMGLLQGLLVFRTAVRQGVALLARVKDKIGAIHAFRSAYDMDKFRPEHGAQALSPPPPSPSGD